MYCATLYLKIFMVNIKSKVKHLVRSHFSGHKKKYRTGLFSSIFVASIFLIIFFVTRGISPHNSELVFTELSILGKSAGSVIPASAGSPPECGTMTPIINAGNDQTISGSSATLAGTYSQFADVWFTSYGWSQTAGNVATISGQYLSPTGTYDGNVGSTLSGLIPGTYTFRYTVVTFEGCTHSDEVVLTVSTPSTPTVNVNFSQ